MRKLSPRNGDLATLAQQPGDHKATPQVGKSDSVGSLRSTSQLGASHPAQATRSGVTLASGSTRADVKAQCGEDPLSGGVKSEPPPARQVGWHRMGSLQAV